MPSDWKAEPISNNGFGYPGTQGPDSLCPGLVWKTEVHHNTAIAVFLKLLFNKVCTLGMVHCAYIGHDNVFFSCLSIRNNAV